MHVVVWEFSVLEEHRQTFERVYNPNGDWAILFRKSPGYLGTELFKDQTDPNRYLTIDRWKTERDFLAFKRDHGDAYRALDQAFEALTRREVKIGAFQTLS